MTTLEKIKIMKEATDTVFDAVDGMEIGDTMFACAAVLAFCLNEMGQKERTVFRNRIMAMLDEADGSSTWKDRIQ